METKSANSPVSTSSRQPGDLICSSNSLFLWWLPTIAVIVGASWPQGRPWLWIPAFLVMGIACAANAARCGRVHCYFTAPLFFLAAVYDGLGEFHVVPLYAGILLVVVLVGTALAFLAEYPLGRYRTKA
ncbi:MAG TPA: hypothetical protein VKS20_11120 [Candidatus Acidoferrales bacterium]|nr:hypothetical protein [Candidatus Acidoferrales bacterium]